MLSCLYVFAISIAEIIAVKTSETGIEYKTPSSPKNKGSNKVRPTPNTISRTIDSIVDSTAFPIACKNIKVALFMQARTIMQRYMRKAFTAKSVLKHLGIILQL